MREQGQGLEWILSELLYADDIVLMSETIVGIRDNLLFKMDGNF